MTGHEYLKEQRLKKGFSLRSLGEMSGVSHAQIKLIEDGVHKPGFETALKLLWALDIRVNDFLRVIGYREPKKKGLVAVQGFEPRTLRI